MKIHGKLTDIAAACFKRSGFAFDFRMVHIFIAFYYTDIHSFLLYDLEIIVKCGLHVKHSEPRLDAEAQAGVICDSLFDLI